VNPAQVKACKARLPRSERAQFEHYLWLADERQREVWQLLKSAWALYRKHKTD
jgi:hypothetical protein